MSDRKIERLAMRKLKRLVEHDEAERFEKDGCYAGPAQPKGTQ